MNILRRNCCHVYAISLEKAKAAGPLDESRFVPLAFQRLLAKFNDEVARNANTGSLVCDWSTHQLDRHLTNCVTSMVVAQQMHLMRGGVTYGSSLALPPLQVADLIAGTFRRSLEGQAYLDDLADLFSQLRYANPGQVDVLGYPVDSILRLF